MNRRMTVALAATVVVAGAVPVMAQDETGAENTHVEVLEAGVALSFPVDWAVDIEMREREDWGFVIDDEDPVAFWNVVYASDGGRPWCDVTWYPAYPLPLAEHAFQFEESMTPSHSSVERSIEVAPVTLPAGEAYRFVIYNEPTDDWTTTYLLEAGEARYLLQCAGDERAEDDWQGLAETLEFYAPAIPQPSTDPSIEADARTP